MSSMTINTSLISASAMSAINAKKFRRVHVYIITEKCGSSRQDLYLNEIILALARYGHEVTLVACAIDTDAAITKIFKKGCTPLPSGKWIIRSLFGHFESFFTFVTLMWSAIYVFFASYILPEEGICIVDNTSAVLPVLRWSLFRTIYIRHFPELFDMHKFYKGYSLETTLIDYYFIKYVDGVIVESIALKEIFQNLYPLSKARVTPLYYISDCRPETPPQLMDLHAMFPLARLRASIKVYFLCVGKYDEISNLYFLFSIFDYISTNYPEYMKKLMVIYIGDKEKLDSLSFIYYEKFHNKCSLKDYHCNLLFIDQITNVKRESLFSQSIAVMHTNPCEYYAGPILKAMALRKPIIAPTTGFASEVLINYFSGILVEYQAKEYAKAMIEIFDNSELRIDLADNAQNEYALNYTEEALAAKVNEIILSPK